MNVATWALVGTRGDMINNPAQHDQVSQILYNEFHGSIAWPPLKHEGAKGRNGKSDMWFFPVDNTKALDDENLQRLLDSIEKALDKAPYVQIKIPLTWFKVLDMMHEYQRVDHMDSSKVKSSFLTYSTVERFCKEHNITDVDNMLQFFHEMGVLMWHRELSLRDMVILNPINYFVTPATMLICKHEQDGDDLTFHC